MVIAFVRTIILYLLIIVGIRLMGKRQVGELEPSELVLALIIADLAAVPMQDFGIPLLSGIIPILTLLAITMIISVLSMKSVQFRILLCGRPSIIVENGTICQKEMIKNRFTVDELMEELRMKGVTDISNIPINDGHILEHNLKLRGYDHNWLEKQLHSHGIKDPKKVYLLTADEKGQTYFVAKEEEK